MRAKDAHHDVAFYSPWIGSMLSSGGSVVPGGAEIQVLMLARELARRGTRVALTAFGDPSDLPRAVDGVTIAACPPHRSRRGVLGKAAAAAQIWRSLDNASSERFVRRGGGLEVGVIALYARITRRTFIFATSGICDFSYSELMPNRIYLLLYRLGVRLADQVVVQTEEQVQMCERTFGRRPTLIKSLATAADCQSGTPEAFLWVGRAVTYKQPLLYVELARRVPEAQFWMVAPPLARDDDDRQLIERLHSEADAVANLHLLPARSHAELGKLTTRAVASVSTGDFEGMPNVLLEAWSRGVPALVLTHDPGGVVASHGLGGFAEGSFERLVELTKEQWTTRADREDLSRRCRDYIEHNHSPATIAEQWLAVLSMSASSEQVPTTEAEQSCVA